MDRAGRVYIGEYREGRREGQGEFIWPDGSRYEGGFKDNLQHGKGAHHDRAGNVRKGMFEKGQHVGMMHN